MHWSKSGLDYDMDIVVEQTETNHASLSFRGLECRCSIGEGKITENKFEGDLCTPAGKWPSGAFFTVKTAYQSQTQVSKPFVFPKIWVGQMIPVMTDGITLL